METLLVVLLIVLLVPFVTFFAVKLGTAAFYQAKARFEEKDGTNKRTKKGVR